MALTMGTVIAMGTGFATTCIVAQGRPASGSSKISRAGEKEAEFAAKEGWGGGGAGTL